MIVRRVRGWLAVIALCAGCAAGPEQADRDAGWRLGDDLRVRTLAPGVWLHTTWREFGSARVPSHGLIVRSREHLVLVDTAWGDEPTRRLLDWIDAELGLPVRLLIVTHGHDDRLGGARAARAAGADVVMGVLTMGGVTTPLRSHDADLLRRGMRLAAPGRSVTLDDLLVYYPGPAHTADNLMVWLEEPQILFGGCAVRPGASSSLGNVADADIRSWADSMERTLLRFGHARMVIPAHGPVGDTRLLSHTADLARAAASQEEGK